MHKIVLIIGLFFGFSANTLYSQIAMREIKEAAGGFSYMAPSDWTLGKIEGMEFQLIRLKEMIFSPNMNFYQEKNDYTFEKYYTVNLKDMEENIHDFKIIEAAPFVTDSKLKGKRLVCSNVQGGHQLVQVYYFIDRKDKLKTLMTGSALLTDKEKYIPIFDTIAKSFKTNK